MSSLVVERIKKRLKAGVEEENLPLDQLYALIEDSMERLLLAGEINEEAVKEFDKGNAEDDKLIEEIINRKAERYKKAYDEIMKL